MEELNKKLAEWAGIDISDAWFLDVIPDFTESLDACFEWLVPKARKEFGITKIDFSYIGDEVGCRLFGGYGALLELSRGNLSKNEAETLCKAIERLIDETS